MQTLPATLDALLLEPIALVKQRERRALHELLDQSQGRVVLFGAGGLGARVLAALRTIDIEPLAFSDNNRERWGTRIDAVEVLSPIDAARKFGEIAVFIVSIWNPEHWYGETRAQLFGLGCRNVSCAARIFWRFPAEFPPFLLQDRPSKVYRAREQVLAGEELWADATSREVYRGLIHWYASGDASMLPRRPRCNSYFDEELYTLTAGEVVVDGGAYDGDTLRDLLSHTGGEFGAVHAVEADADSFDKLRGWWGRLPSDLRSKVHLHECALSRFRGVTKFKSGDGDGSRVHDGGDVLVESMPLDMLFAGTHLTLLKLDIEGAEYDALQGGRVVIERDGPVLAICAYHNQNDLWRIPLLMRELLPDHLLFLRSYEGDGFQTVAFAVPVERAKVRADAKSMGAMGQR